MLQESEVLNILSKYNNQRQNILFILKEIQNNDEDKEIKEEYCKIISREMDITLAKIYEIITFYSMFSTNKQGKYVIEICGSGPCYVSKSKDIVDYLEERLEIKIGETTTDNMFTLKLTSCMGSCDISPAMRISEKVYGNLTRKKVDEIIEGILV